MMTATASLPKLADYIVTRSHREVRKLLRRISSRVARHSRQSAGSKNRGRGSHELGRLSVKWPIRFAATACFGPSNLLILNPEEYMSGMTSCLSSRDFTIEHEHSFEGHHAVVEFDVPGMSRVSLLLEIQCRNVVAAGSILTGGQLVGVVE